MAALDYLMNPPHVHTYTGTIHCAVCKPTTEGGTHSLIRT